MKNIMKEAHELTKEIKREYPEVDYKAQLGLCISFLSKEGGKDMAELKGTPKQVTWAEDIRAQMIEAFEAALAKKENRKNNKIAAGEDVSEKLESIIANLKLIIEKINSCEDAAKFINNCKYFNSDDSIEAKTKEAIYIAKHYQEYFGDDLSEIAKML